MNRKLIRTTLAQVKEREANHKETTPTAEVKTSNGARLEASRSNENSRSNTNAAAQGRKRAPTLETNAEAFYYKKQMESHTAMIFMLQDGEELEGTIEWYDRAAFKINRQGAANILLLKNNIKYMYKAADRVDE